MKKLILLLLFCFANLTFANKLSTDPNEVINEMITEISILQKNYYIKYNAVNLQIEQVQSNLLTENSLEKKG